MLFRCLLLLTAIVATDVLAQDPTDLPVISTLTARHDPDYVWHTTDVGPFLIHSVEGHEAHARKMAAMARRIYAKISAALDN